MPDISPITSLAFGGGRFAAATSDGLSFSQDNGLTWTDSPTAGTGKYNDLLYAGDLFVAVGDAGIIQTSVDGATWTSNALSVTNDLYTITHGNGIYVATGTGGLIATSTDAIRWTILPSQSTTDLFYAAFGNGRFLLLEPNAVSLISTNGTNWTRQFHNIAQGPDCALTKSCISWSNPFALTFGNGQFVMKLLGRTTWTLNYPYLLASADGLNWHFVSYGPSTPPSVSFRANNLHHAGGLFVELADRLFSANLVDWTPFDIPGDPGGYAVGSQAVAHGNGTFIVGGPSLELYPTWANVAVGPDLRQLSHVNRAIPGIAVSLANEGDVIVAVMRSGPDGLAASTNGGFTFQSIPLPGGVASVNSVTYSGGYFLAVGPEGTILRSTNGITWSRRLSNTSSELTDIAFGSGLFVAVGANGRIVTSPDASSFVLRSSGTEISLNNIDYGGTAFVAVGRAGLILSSTNGLDWSSFGTEEAQDLLSVAYGNGRFVATGTNGIVHVSTNRIDWTTTSISGARTLSHVAYADGRFIAVDSQIGSAYISTNGLGWSPISTPRPTLTVESYGGKFWLAGALFIARELGDGADGTIPLSITAANDQITLNFIAPEQGTYAIQAVEDLASSWTPVAVFTNTAGLVVWADTNATSRARFYRVVTGE